MSAKKMRAIVKPTAGPGLIMTDAPVHTPGVNDVLIKIKKTSICGTDVHINKWDQWAARTIKPPLIIGHEYVGTVADVGAGVEGFELGQLVTGEGHIVCGHCRNCLAGRRHLCPNTKGVGVNRDGAFADYVTIPQSNVWKVPVGMDTDVVSCFDPLGNAVHTALSFDLVGEDVLITGAGPIGCMAIAVARAAGARKIVITDINDGRLELAKKLNPTRVVNVAKENLPDVWHKELGMTEGFDVGLEMSGSPQALRQMIDNMVNGGRIALLGIMSGEVAIDWNKVVFKMLHLKGVYGREMFETWYKMTALVQGGMDIRPVITHRFPVERFQEGFELMGAGKSGKIVLNWE
ncbi:MAG: L-threonine 3-dehydrogenase [Candidatus Didemnitutus sp.]|nr:L-threonine 3-dehydrogenase [Candidatus Didemnitutus sp.]